MKKIYTTVILFGLAILLNRSYAAVDIFMKVTDETGTAINGESQVTNYVNWIEILSLGDGSDNKYDYSTTTLRATLTPFSFQTILNNAALSLLKRVYTGQRLRTVDIYFVKTGSTTSCNCPFYKIHMENVVVKDFQESVGGEGVPYHQFSFAPQKFAWAYYKQDSNGTTPTTPTVKFGWDLSTNGEYNYNF